MKPVNLSLNFGSDDPPLDFGLSPTHAKLNHSVLQSGPSNPIISPKAEVVQLGSIIIRRCRGVCREEIFG